MGAKERKRGTTKNTKDTKRKGERERKGATDETRMEHGWGKDREIKDRKMERIFVFPYPCLPCYPWFNLFLSYFSAPDFSVKRMGSGQEKEKPRGSTRSTGLSRAWIQTRTRPLRTCDGGTQGPKQRHRRRGGQGCPARGGLFAVNFLFL